MKSLLQMLAAVTLISFLVACSKLSGSYTSVSPPGAVGMITIDFESSSKAIMEINGAKSEATYSVDGKNVKFEANGTNQIFELQDDGSLTTGSAIVGRIVLKKK